MSSTARRSAVACSTVQPPSPFGNPTLVDVTLLPLIFTSEGSSRSLNDVVRLQQQQRWDREAERLRGLEVHHELECPACTMSVGSSSRRGRTAYARHRC